MFFNLDTFNGCSNNSRYLSIFNKVKSKFNINADDQSIIDFLIADNKHINKQSKKKKLLLARYTDDDPAIGHTPAVRSLDNEILNRYTRK